MPRRARAVWKSCLQLVAAKAWACNWVSVPPCSRISSAACLASRALALARARRDDDEDNGVEDAVLAVAAVVAVRDVGDVVDVVETTST